MSHLKKYANRPSPPYPANECRNKTMTGNDGNIYASIPDKRGRFTWKKKSKVLRSRRGTRTRSRSRKPTRSRSRSRSPKRSPKRTQKTSRRPKRQSNKKSKRSSLKPFRQKQIWGKYGSVYSPKQQHYVRLGTPRSFTVLRDELTRDAEWHRRVRWMIRNTNQSGFRDKLRTLTKSSEMRGGKRRRSGRSLKRRMRRKIKVSSRKTLLQTGKITTKTGKIGKTASKFALAGSKVATVGGRALQVAGVATGQPEVVGLGTTVNSAGKKGKAASRVTRRASSVLKHTGRSQRSAARGDKKKARAQGLKTVRHSVQLAKTGERQYSNLS